MRACRHLVWEGLQRRHKIDEVFVACKIRVAYINKAALTIVGVAFFKASLVVAATALCV